MSLSSMSMDRDRGGRLPAQVVVPTDCPSCQSAGSVRRGVCDNCGARAVEQHLSALRTDQDQRLSALPDQVELQVAQVGEVTEVATAGEPERLAVPA
jgi:hypothetical protein